MIAVNTDASFREDLLRAGIAYCGGLGRAAQVVDARGVNHAEMLALVLAMSAAHARGVEYVTFRHDAEISLRGSRFRGGSAYGAAADTRALIRKILAEHPSWKLKQIKRTYNAEANILARRVLKLETGNETVKAHCVQAAERELARMERAA